MIKGTISNALRQHWSSSSTATPGAMLLCQKWKPKHATWILFDSLESPRHTNQPSPRISEAALLPFGVIYQSASCHYTFSYLVWHLGRMYCPSFLTSRGMFGRSGARGSLGVGIINGWCERTNCCAPCFWEDQRSSIKTHNGMWVHEITQLENT